ncbi:MAG: hypothetical protein LBV68_07350, partial [Spirochaetaceae bacterium]|nr:hypothetical protein [Spirochaetaceae bacterium]
DSASVLFYQGNPGVSLVYFEDDMLPNPEEKTYWNPIAFPADTAFTMMVHAYYAQSNNYNPSLIGSLVTTTITASRSVDTDVLFNCPPLGAGKNYKLVFRKGSGVSGKNILVLIDSETNKIVYRQEFSAK